MFKTVGLIGKHGDARVAQTIETLVSYLRTLAVDILFDAESAAGLPSFGLPVVDRKRLGGVCDLIIIVAGDGTFLDAARSVVDQRVPLVGINLGRLGFLADLMPAEMQDVLAEIFNGNFSEDQRFLLEARVERAGEHIFSTVALNDIVIHKWNIARLIEFETHIDGRLVNNQRSDGLIVATPTGSTAYALSGGGPIIHPGLDAIVLVPICPHTLSSRPIVVSGESRIDVVVAPSPRPEAQLTCDGQSTLELAPGDRVGIGKYPNPIRLIHPPGHDYFATLRAKLHWGRGL